LGRLQKFNCEYWFELGADWIHLRYFSGSSLADNEDFQTPDIDPVILRSNDPRDRVGAGQSEGERNVERDLPSQRI
jgi:hypothetical protein